MTSRLKATVSPPTESVNPGKRYHDFATRRLVVKTALYACGHRVDLGEFPLCGLVSQVKTQEALLRKVPCPKCVGRSISRHQRYAPTCPACKKRRSGDRILSPDKRQERWYSCCHCGHEWEGRL